jgi:hypothetical protein
VQAGSYAVKAGVQQRLVCPQLGSEAVAGMHADRVRAAKGDAEGGVLGDSFFLFYLQILDQACDNGSQLEHKELRDGAAAGLVRNETCQSLRVWLSMVSRQA